MSVKENYKVTTEVFSGPLDLLLSLIESRKMHISEVSLSKITDDYISYLDKLEKFSIKSSTDFILTAAILMLIKSKSLLPDLDLTKEEEKSIGELEERLKEYRRIKDLSINIENLFGKKIIFFRQPTKEVEVVFSPEKNITKENLFFLIRGIIKQLPIKNLSSKVTVGRIISLEEVIDNLSTRIKTSLRMSFKEYSGMDSKKELSKERKINIVVSFLAMLELIKQGIIDAKQENRFGDINMDTQQVGVPNYK